LNEVSSNATLLEELRMIALLRRVVGSDEGFYGQACGFIRPSWHSSKSEIRYAQRQINSDLAFDRQRLQRYRAAGSADQHLGAQTQA
jgi:hypothetical protein